MKLKPFFRWYDLWVGCYWDGKERALYVCLLPMIGVKIKLGSKAPELRCIGAYVDKWDENGVVEMITRWEKR